MSVPAMAQIAINDTASIRKAKIQTITECISVYKVQNSKKYIDEYYSHSRIGYMFCKKALVFHVRRFDTIGQLAEELRIDIHGDTSHHKIYETNRWADGRINYKRIIDVSNGKKTLVQLEQFRYFDNIHSFTRELFQPSLDPSNPHQTDSFVFDSTDRFLQQFFVLNSNGKPFSKTTYDSIGRWIKITSFARDASDTLRHSVRTIKPDGSAEVEATEYHSGGNYYTHSRYDSHTNEIFHRSLTPEQKILTHWECTYENKNITSRTTFYEPGDQVYKTTMYRYKDGLLHKEIGDNHNLRTYSILRYLYRETSQKRVVIQKLNEFWLTPYSWRKMTYSGNIWFKGRKTEKQVYNLQGLLIETRRYGFNYGFWSRSTFSYTYYP